jgi:hypothetical protein
MELLMMTLSYDAYVAAEQAFDAAVDRYGLTRRVTADTIEEALYEYFETAGLPLRPSVLHGDGIVCVVVVPTTPNPHPDDYRYMNEAEWAAANVWLAEGGVEWRAQ